MRFFSVMGTAASVLEHCLPQMALRSFECGERVYEQGSTVDKFFILIQGRVEVPSAHSSMYSMYSYRSMYCH